MAAVGGRDAYLVKPATTRSGSDSVAVAVALALSPEGREVLNPTF